MLWLDHCCRSLSSLVGFLCGGFLLWLDFGRVVVGGSVAVEWLVAFM